MREAYSKFVSFLLAGTLRHRQNLTRLRLSFLLVVPDVLHALDQISKHPAHTVALASSQASTDDDVTTSRVAKGHASDMLSLFRRNALINLSIALVFTVTLSVFPAVTAQVVPVGRSGWWRRTEIWVPLGFLAFNGASARF